MGMLAAFEIQCMKKLAPNDPWLLAPPGIIILHAIPRNLAAACRNSAGICHVDHVAWQRPLEALDQRWNVMRWMGRWSPWPRSLVPIPPVTLNKCNVCAGG